MRALRLSAVAMALLAMTRGEAVGQETGLKGLGLVVEGRGPDPFARESLLRTLRRDLVDVVGPLRSASAFDRARKELGPRMQEAGEPRALAAAGRKVGAEYVVSVELGKGGKGGDASLRLVDTVSGRVELESREPFADASTDVVPLAETLAARVIHRLKELRTPESGFEPKLAHKDPIPLWRRSDAVVKRPPPPPPRPPPPPERPPPVVDEVVAEAPPAEVTPERIEVLRCALGYGSGLMRGYQLVSPDLGRSALSYHLGVVPSYAGKAELFLPRTAVAFALAGAYRPVVFRVSAPDVGDSAPSGGLIDVLVNASYQLPVGEWLGRGTWTMHPRLGGRYSLLQVANHPGNVILSAATYAVTVGASVVGQVKGVEMEAGLDVGRVLGYSEGPRTSGTSAGGFTFGAEVNARLWIFEGFGLAFDSRLTMDRIGFTGRPTRVLPPAERGRLTDVAIDVNDLRASLGVAFRL
jgi:hypothetical protein